MCFDPVTMSVVAGVASAGMSVMQGAQQNQAAKQQSSILQAQADREIQISNLEADQLNKENSALLAKQRAALAGNGIDVTSGAALLLQADSAKTASMDESIVRAGGEARANSLRNQAALAQSSGSGAFGSSVFRAGSTLLNTGMNYADLKGVRLG